MTTYSSLWTAHPQWIPAAVKAAQQGHAKDLYRPPGFETAAYRVHWMPRVDGLVGWALSYRLGPRGKAVTVARWVTDWLPPESPHRKPVVVKPPDKPIHITSEGADYWVRVVLDHLGLPKLVPIQEAA